MAKEIDAYREWLGIPDTVRPPNYYQLLRVKVFEDNVAQIRENYRKLNAKVRTYATGDFAAVSQRLLNELAKAMLCLTDAQRKREYDVTLGRKDAGGGRRRTLEEILLANKVVDTAQLTKARQFAAAVGLELRDAVVQQKMAPPDAVMLCYAESIGLPYVDLADVGVAESIVPKIPAPLARQHSCVPVMIDGNQLLMASPNPLVPDVEEELRLRFDMPVRTVLCTPASINAAVQKYYARDLPADAPRTARRAAKAAADDEEEDDRPPATPQARAETLRQQIQYSFIAFNIGVVLVTFLLWMFGRPVTTTGGAAGVMGLAVVVGLIAGAITFYVFPKLR